MDDLGREMRASEPSTPMETVAASPLRDAPMLPQHGDFPVNLPFALDEVRIVAAFCIRRLSGLQTSDVVALNDAVVTYEANSGKGPDAASAAGTIIAGYNKLNDLLADRSINGASVYDSSTFSWTRQSIVWCGGLLLLLGVGCEILSAGDDLFGQHVPFLPAVARYLGPMAWGGLGAAVFLMKALSDKVCDFAYEERRLSGTAARILIGAVFGLMAPVAFPTDSTALPTMATAFVAGLGAKAVYAALEALVNGIATHISGKGAGPGPSGATSPPQS
ncbi:MAG: hypothetical protein U1E45_06330 [Geminicoccaceae bacterium]